MEAHMKDFGKIENLTVKVITRVQPWNTKEDGSKTNCMDLVQQYGKMEEDIKEITSMERNRAKEHTVTLTEKSTLASGYQAFSTVTDRYTIQRDRLREADGLTVNKTTHQRPID